MRCFACGAETPLAVRRVGHWSKLSAEHRKRLHYCPDHEAAAIARRDAAQGVAVRDNPDTAAPVASPIDAGRRVASDNQGGFDFTGE